MRPNVGPLLTLGIAQAQTGDYQSAKASLESFLDHYPEGDPRFPTKETVREMIAQLNAEPTPAP